MGVIFIEGSATNNFKIQIVGYRKEIEQRQHEVSRETIFNCFLYNYAKVGVITIYKVFAESLSQRGNQKRTLL